MAGIIEAGDLPLESKVYLKKDIFGYRVIHPIKNDDGSINWPNLLFGGWKNLFLLLFILGIIGFLLWSNNHDLQVVKDFYGNISEDPYYACADTNELRNGYDTEELNLSILSTDGKSYK